MSFSLVKFSTAEQRWECVYRSVDYDFQSKGEPLWGCSVQKFALTSENDAKQVIPFKDPYRSTVDAVLIFNEICHFVPQTVAESFGSQIRAFGIQNSVLKKISNKDLRQFGDSLEYLKLNSNYLANLEFGLFQYNPNLKSINLSSNQLKSIPYQCFYNLPFLSEVEILYNPCMSKVYSGKKMILKLLHSRDLYDNCPI